MATRRRTTGTSSAFTSAPARERSSTRCAARITISSGPNYVPRRSVSGIWARGGAVVDPDSTMNGRIYVSTGNGDFDANRGGFNYGDSVLSLSADLVEPVGKLHADQLPAAPKRRRGSRQHLADDPAGAANEPDAVDARARRERCGSQAAQPCGASRRRKRAAAHRLAAGSLLDAGRLDRCIEQCLDLFGIPRPRRGISA